MVARRSKWRWAPRHGLNKIYYIKTNLKWQRFPSVNLGCWHGMSNVLKENKPSWADGRLLFRFKASWIVLQRPSAAMQLIELRRQIIMRRVFRRSDMCSSRRITNGISIPKTNTMLVALIKSLHWLPVKVRSTYKIACLCYHCHSSTAPSYVTDMLHRKPLQIRNTRSSSYIMPLLNRPAHSKATLGDRSFSFASSFWNSIPNDVRCAPSLSRGSVYKCFTSASTFLPVNLWHCDPCEI